jgi:hypothetical protein
MKALLPWTLRNRLLLVLLSLAALPSVLIGLLAYRNARLTLETRVQAQLTSIATLKKTQLPPGSRTGSLMHVFSVRTF